MKTRRLWNRITNSPPPMIEHDIYTDPISSGLATVCGTIHESSWQAALSLSFRDLKLLE